jgi:protein arginine N-methyltransferase 1
MSLILDEHRQYLEDFNRVSAFRRAIHEVVKAGDVVLDLGCGTGILGLLACEAGASRVYAIDSGDMIRLAQEIAAANGLTDRIVHVRELSTRATLPEKVDVVVGDQIGQFGFDAGVLEYFEDAKRRLLKPGGATVPSHIELWVSAVEAPALHHQVEFWNTRPAEFDFTPASRIASNTGYPVTYQPAQLLTQPGRLVTLDATSAARFNGKVSATVARNGTLDGVGGWFEARLSPCVRMTNSPLSDLRINRRSVFFPVERPTAVRRDDRVELAFDVIPRHSIVNWTLEVNRGGEIVERLAHSTLRGMLISKQFLHKTRPDFVPVLTPWGQARRSVVDLCDGKRRLCEIEQQVYERHRDLFSNPGEAEGFVAEVISTYAKG